MCRGNAGFRQCIDRGSGCRAMARAGRSRQSLVRGQGFHGGWELHRECGEDKEGPEQSVRASFWRSWTTRVQGGRGRGGGQRQKKGHGRSATSSTKATRSNVCMARPIVAAGRSGHRMHTVLTDCNVGLLVWAGRRGGGGHAPSGSKRSGCSSEHAAPLSHSL